MGIPGILHYEHARPRLIRKGSYNEADLGREGNHSLSLNDQNT